MKGRDGEHFFCRLPDDTICSLPSWMFSPHSRLSLEQPAIDVEALCELRDLLSTLQNSSPCDKTSLTSQPREEKDETAAKAKQATTRPAATRLEIVVLSLQPVAGSCFACAPLTVAGRLAPAADAPTPRSPSRRTRPSNCRTQRSVTFSCSAASRCVKCPCWTSCNTFNRSDLACLTPASPVRSSGQSAGLRQELSTLLE